MPAQTTVNPKRPPSDSASLREEVESRYLAYALSTIVARALPDVRDGLKPVHRRILYAMHAMRLGDSAKMRKSAAVVGEVIGKYHPHGDQAAYDALVRMAQNFSLRYPLVEGSGNFGSVDGDAPAAMRYTETRLSAFAGLLLRDIEQGTTEFHATYDAMGEEPFVLPAAVPNLLLNGSSGIAVGMSCSFPPHNVTEVISACRAAIRDPKLNTKGLLKYVKGPDFPTHGEILDDSAALEEVYASGHGSIRLRGSYTVETSGRGRTNLIVTSIPYSVNKSRLIERIAILIKDRRLKYVQDVRDESTADVRIVLELKGSDVRPESVMAFLYKHTDLQINFPMNFIAITPQGVPERLGLEGIIRHFLDFRYEKIVMRLQHRLEILRKRIHVLEGFDILFRDLDRALSIIRSSRSRQEAEQGLKAAFPLDDEQVEAILETRLYRLVGMEIGKILDELAAKKKEAKDVSADLASPERLWKIIDSELGEVAAKFGDCRRTSFITVTDAPALEYDPEEFVEHEDSTVILSRQGWIHRLKSEVDDPSALKFREGDGLFACVRVNTGRTVAIFSNLGKIYVSRVIDVPATTGFGEPIGSLFNLGDGEFVVGFIAPDPVEAKSTGSAAPTEPEPKPVDVPSEFDQPSLFETSEQPEQTEARECALPSRGILITRDGQGFRFDYDMLREPSKRVGRKLVQLRENDETVAVKAEEGRLVVVGTDAGNVLVFPVDEAPLLAGPRQGVRMIKLKGAAQVIALELVNPDDHLRIMSKRGKDHVAPVADLTLARRGGQGKIIAKGLAGMERMTSSREQDR